MTAHATRLELPPTGLDADLTEDEKHMQRVARCFATDVMRPIGQLLDRMTAQQVIAADSPLWRLFEEFSKLGVTLKAMLELPAADRARVMALVFEEFGYGDGGLAVAIGASLVPGIILHQTGRHDLLERYADRPLGCWAMTEPDHGTDMLDSRGQLLYPGSTHGRLSCYAKIVDKRIVISGKKAAWVSNGPTAQLCILFCGFDDGSGIDKRCVVLVPLDSQGITRGAPWKKWGNVACPRASCSSTM